jgi:hypothetical protein
MKRKIFTLALLSLMFAVFLVGTALANPNTIEDGFVCPVLGGEAGMNGEAKGISYVDNTGLPVDSFYTTLRGAHHEPVFVSVPRQATNGNNGVNNPHGPYASPGDEDYTAIWP